MTADSIGYRITDDTLVTPTGQFSLNDICGVERKTDNGTGPLKWLITLAGLVVALLLAPTVIGFFLVGVPTCAYYIRVQYIVVIYTRNHQIPVATFSSYEPFYGGDAAKKASIVADLIAQNAPQHPTTKPAT
jgi:hypothetical protein